MIKRFLLGALLGAPWFAAFSPYSLWWIGLIQLVVLFALLLHSEWYRKRDAFALGLGFGTGAFGVGVSWLYISLHTYGGLVAPLAASAILAFSLYLALFGAVAGTLFHHLAHKRPLPDWLLVLLWAALWTFFSWLRGTLFTGFAWLSLGDGLVDSPLNALLPWFGSYGVLFVALVLALALVMIAFRLFANRSVRPALGSVWAFSGLALLSIVLSYVPLPIKTTGALHVVGVQTNVDQDIKFDPDLIEQNMANVFALGDDAHSKVPPHGVLIFPETVDPLVWSDTPLDWQTHFRDYAGKDGRKVIMGAALEEHDQYYNAIVMFNGDESGASLDVPPLRHNKRHLVPFGEFIPWGFHWFVRMLNMPMGEFTRGKGKLDPFQVEGRNEIASTVCYEDTFGGEFATLLAHAKREPTVLLNLSNLAWFGQSWALDQHAQMGRARSAEHRKPGLRVTNTGLSGLIDDHGQWVKRITPGVPTDWEVTFHGKTGITPFARYGALWWYCIWMVVLVIYGVRSRR